MAYTNTEVVDAALDALNFLVADFGFQTIVKDARGTYLSQIVFQSSYLEIFIGVWGQGNEFWFTFTPLGLAGAPAFELNDLLNGITKNRTYFDQNIRDKVEWPIFAHTFPEYFELCSMELKKHCKGIFTGDLSVWMNIAYQVLVQRIEERLGLLHRPKLELSEREKSNLDPLLSYLKSNFPNISLEKIESDILDRMTQI